MTPEQGYHLAQFQRPGVRIIIGPTEAREDAVQPLSEWAIYSLPGDPSWRVRDTRIFCGGWLPCWKFMRAGFLAEDLTGEKLTLDEWKFLRKAIHADLVAWIGVKMEASKCKSQ